ncbi:hypothetical protein [Acidiluteibacter ferrifornacis]|uniref:SGNH/GDSL hydrolase family protein n=1 Tax=Acidiluteibacter ferrifornacis TaxID=2692424 RepID=A0A6N9NJW5_9FLAO|nr:hypothetical protein [Acidiluteibacter ferrifornacis]MBR9831809.1 hypothetical protein [bacterium]NBG66149.1 hypothetical protein [Acidiluteibacter ferrifornacis]
MRKFLFKITYLILFFIIMGAINYALDEQMIFHQENLEKAVEGLQKEDTIYGVSHVHKPYLHFKYAKQLKRPKDVLVIGASDCAQLGENIFKGMDVFSQWAPGSGLFFQLAILNEYDKRGMLPKQVVLALRPYYISNKDPRPLDVIAEPYLEMLEKMNLEQPTLGVTSIKILKDKFQELFSAKYLVYNLKSETHEISKVKTLNERFIMFPDGTVKNNFIPQKEIAENTLQETIEFYSEAINSPKSELILLHHKLIDYLQDKGVVVSFFILPFHPKMMNDKSFKEVNKKWKLYTRELERKYRVKLFGGTDPTDFGLTETDFLDISHVKRGSMWKLFSFFKDQNPLN